jgi:flagellar hook-length control protein FliK
MILDFTEYWEQRVKAGTKAAQEACAKLSGLKADDPNFDKKYAAVAKLIEANATDIDNFNKALIANDSNRIEETKNLEQVKLTAETNRIEEEKTKELAKANARHDVIEAVKIAVSLGLGAAGLACKWGSVKRVTEKEGGDNPEPILGLADRSVVTEAMKDKASDFINWFRF